MDTEIRPTQSIVKRPDQRQRPLEASPCRLSAGGQSGQIQDNVKASGMVASCLGEGRGGLGMGEDVWTSNWLFEGLWNRPVEMSNTRRMCYPGVWEPGGAWDGDDGVKAACGKQGAADSPGEAGRARVLQPGQEGGRMALGQQLLGRRWWRRKLD